MEILNKIPENLRNSKASEAIITQFFEEHDVNKMIEEEKSKKVAPSRPACLPPQIKNVCSLSFLILYKTLTKPKFIGWRSQ